MQKLIRKVRDWRIKYLAFHDLLGLIYGEKINNDIYFCVVTCRCIGFLIKCPFDDDPRTNKIIVSLNNDMSFNFYTY